jgi:hypothetical protein
MNRPGDSGIMSRVLVSLDGPIKRKGEHERQSQQRPVSMLLQPAPSFAPLIGLLTSIRDISPRQEKMMMFTRKRARNDRLFGPVRVVCQEHGTSVS